MKPVSYDVVLFVSEFNHISPLDLEEIMENLQDKGYLSPKGIAFRNAFWKLLIKE